MLSASICLVTAASFMPRNPWIYLIKSLLSVASTGALSTGMTASMSFGERNARVLSIRSESALETPAIHQAGGGAVDTTSTKPADQSISQTREYLHGCFSPPWLHGKPDNDTWEPYWRTSNGQSIWLVWAHDFVWTPRRRQPWPDSCVQRHEVTLHGFGDPNSSQNLHLLLNVRSNAHQCVHRSS